MQSYVRSSVYAYIFHSRLKFWLPKISAESRYTTVTPAKWKNADIVLALSSLFMSLRGLEKLYAHWASSRERVQQESRVVTWLHYRKVDAYVRFIWVVWEPGRQLAGSSRKETESCAFGCGCGGGVEVKNVKSMGRETEQVAPHTPRAAEGILTAFPETDVVGWRGV